MAQQQPGSSRENIALEHLTDALDRRIPFQRIHYWVIFLVALGALFDGMEQFNAGYIAPVIKQHWDLSATSVGAITSLTFAGLGVGALLAGVAADKYGRKVTFMYNLGLYTAGALIGALAPNLTILLISRVIIGVGLGGELNVGITLLSEFVPTRRRGPATAIADIACGGLGLFASAALAAIMLGPMAGLLGGLESAWRWLLGVLSLPAALLFVYRRYLPETPRYLLSRGRIDAANTVLSQVYSNRLRPKPDMKVFNFISPTLRGEIKPERINILDIFRGPMLRNTVVLWTLGLMAFGAQITVNAFLPTILAERGMPVGQSLTYTMIINSGGLVGGILAAVLGNYWRRRLVLGYGGLAGIVMTIAFLMAEQHVVLVLATGAILQLVFIMINTTTWIYAPELYSTRVRGFGTGTFISVTAVAGTVTPLLGGAVIDLHGSTALFILVAAMYTVLTLVARVGPETHGRSLEELSELAEGRGTGKTVTTR